MTLTDAQYVIFKNDLLVAHQAEFATWVTGREDQLIADAYTLLASPDFWVWRTSVPKDELVGQPSSEGTTFIWAGNGFITRSVQELLTWQELFDNNEHAVNPSLPQIRSAFADIFSGAANAALNRAHCLVVARRKALRIERLFATGTGSTGSPGLLTVEGAISLDDVAHVLNS